MSSKRNLSRWWSRSHWRGRGVLPSRSSESQFAQYSKRASQPPDRFPSEPTSNPLDLELVSSGGAVRGFVSLGSSRPQFLVLRLSTWLLADLHKFLGHTPPHQEVPRDVFFDGLDVVVNDGKSARVGTAELELHSVHENAVFLCVVFLRKVLPDFLLCHSSLIEARMVQR